MNIKIVKIRLFVAQNTYICTFECEALMCIFTTLLRFNYLSRYRQMKSYHKRRRPKGLALIVILCVLLLACLGEECFVNNRTFDGPSTPQCSFGIVMCPRSSSQYYQEDFSRLRWATKRLSKDGKFSALIVAGQNTSAEVAEVDSMANAIRQDLPDMPIALVNNEAKNPVTAMVGMGEVVGHGSSFLVIAPPLQTRIAVIAGAVLFGKDNIYAMNINDMSGLRL